MVPGDDGRPTHDLDGLDRAFAAGGALLVHVNPHNPTGRVFTEAEQRALAAVVERHGVRVFADEIHAPLVYPGSVHRPYASLSERTAAHTVTATSASKAFNVPGLKAAQLLLSNAADAAHWAEVGELAGHGASTPGVLATTAASAAPATRVTRPRRGRSAGDELVDEAGAVLVIARRDRSPLAREGRARPGAAAWVGMSTELPPLSGHGGIGRHGGVRR